MLKMLMQNLSSMQLQFAFFQPAQIPAQNKSKMGVGMAIWDNSLSIDCLLGSPIDEKDQ